MKTLLSAVVVLSVVALVGCAQPAQEPASEDAAARHEADLRAVQDLTAQWDVAFAAQGCEGLASLVTDDYVRLVPDGPPLVGKQAFLENCQKHNEPFTYENSKNVIVEIRVDRDLAFVRGTWTATRTPKGGGESVEVSGPWLDIKERQPDGSWKSARAAVYEDEPALDPAGGQQ